MKGIITVIGKDQIGIIGKVCILLSKEGINILDINQTIVQGYFNMMMIVDLSESEDEFVFLVEKLEKLGEEIGVLIRLQREDIFNCMHRV